MMLTLNQFNDYVKFKKTIDDALYSSANNQAGLMYQISTSAVGTKPLFYTDTDHPVTANDLQLLDDILIEKFGQRFLNRSGGNLYTFDSTDDELVDPTATTMATVMNHIILRNLNKWNYEWNGYWAEYNPIHNYDMSQTETYNNVQDQLTKAGSEKESHAFDETVDPSGINPSSVVSSNSANGTNLKTTTTYARDYDETRLASDNIENTFDNSKYSDEHLIQGFDNSGGTAGGDYTTNTGYNQQTKDIHISTSTDNDPSISKTVASKISHIDNDDSTESTESFGGTTVGTTYTTTSGGRSGDASDNYDELTFTDRTDTNVKTGNITLVRSGNIGVTTSTQMLTQEFEFRNMYNFIDILLKDIADFIGFKIY